MAERKTNSAPRSGGQGKNSGTRTGSTGRSKPSQKALEAEIQRQKEEAIRRSNNRRHVATVIMFAVGIMFTLAAVIPASEGEGWRGFFDIMHGLFGYSAFLIGPLLIFIAVRLSAFKGGAKLGTTIAGCVAGILLLCAVVQIFAVGSTPGENFGEVITNLFNDGKEFRGGGVFALVIGGLLLLLGRLGASILVVLLILVFILLVTGVTVADFTKRVAKPIRSARDKTVEHHRRVKEENRLAAERFDLEQEELERIQAEIDEEQSDKRTVAELKKAVFSVAEPEKPSVNEVSFTPEEAVSPQEQSPEPAPAEDPEPLSHEEALMQEQQEDDKDYIAEVKDYIMQKNRAVLEEAEKNAKDPLEDENAELVPILDAIHRFKEDDPGTVPVKRIEDLPENSVTSSDEGELPFDIDDVLDEPDPPAAPQDKPQTSEPAPKPEIIEVPRPNPVQSVKPTSAAPSVPFKKPAPEELHFSDVYTLPPVTLLNPIERKVSQADIDNEIDRNSKKLVEALQSFGVQTKLVGVSRGPSVTRYELQPAPGVKISKITGLTDDIALNLASAGVRIEAPIPNKSAVGIEVPNKVRDTVFFRELVDTTEFKKSFDKKLETVLGKDISGAMVTCNIAKMPHLLIAGTTGSGKSVCVNSIIMSILMKSTPQDVRLIMIDPKKVEFMMYNGIPHLLIPVVTDPKKAAGALAWAVNEMLNRYRMFSENNVRDFTGFNELAADPDSGLTKMTHIVIFIDELADLMMASPKDVEDSIVRLAQMARAAGMHLVIATQRPTVNVVTGLIKANIPSRIALMVASSMDSRVILDSGGAEKLLGNGDMLYMPVGMPKPVRVQGCFVSDKEVERTVDFIKQTFQAEYDELIMEEIERQTEMVAAAQESGKQSFGGDGGDIDSSDERLEEAIDFVVESGTCSTSSLQRRLKLGYGRAARLVDIMEEMGIVGPLEGSKPRQVLMTKQEWTERKLQQR
ncbi:MAG: DNA translocase FtsK [Oscillospiraceae bacterium]